MLDAATTALLRAVLDEVCETVSEKDAAPCDPIRSRILETVLKPPAVEDPSLVTPRKWR